jgi:Family of unknown function (DUF6913)
MELFRRLRVRAGNSILSGKLAKTKRKPHYIDFFHIKTICLVWDASKTEDFIVLTRFHQKMAELGKEVKIFGFYPEKVFPDQYTAIRYLTCLKKRELNLFFIPVNHEAETFIKTEFDVLIDINFKKHFPLVYITTLSRAGLKIGLAGSRPETSPFDLMISMKSPINIEKYLEQVLYYLNMINSESARKAV